MLLNDSRSDRIVVPLVRGNHGVPITELRRKPFAEQRGNTQVLVSASAFDSGVIHLLLGSVIAESDEDELAANLDDDDVLPAHGEERPQRDQDRALGGLQDELVVGAFSNFCHELFLPA